MPAVMQPSWVTTIDIGLISPISMVTTTNFSLLDYAMHVTVLTYFCIIKTLKQDGVLAYVYIEAFYMHSFSTSALSLRFKRLKG